MNKLQPHLISTLVVDDEPFAGEFVASYVRQTPFLSFEKYCSSAVEALDYIRHRQVDLIFLDIQMPELSGMEFSKMIKEPTRVIFTTAFEQYALQGFKVDALDYLLKPISYPEFLVAANKAHKWFEMIRSAGSQPRESAESKSIFLKVDYSLVQVYFDQITYIEGEKDYIRVHKSDGSNFLSLMNLKAMESLLSEGKFARVHRSYIVNISAITSIQKNMVMVGANSIPISDSYRESFFTRIHSS